MKTVLVLKDKANTRLVADAVTSWSLDYDIIQNGSYGDRTETLILSIGSAVLKLKYENLELRDFDAKSLDDHFKNSCG